MRGDGILIIMSINVSSIIHYQIQFVILASKSVVTSESMVRPHLEYANSVWCPHKLGDIKEIEKVQKRATKLVINLKKIPYTNRLQRLKLPTLKYRRLLGDMIEVFKTTHNIYDPDVSLKLEYNLGCSTRGNKYKLLNCTFCHNLRKYFLCTYH